MKKTLSALLLSLLALPAFPAGPALAGSSDDCRAECGRERNRCQLRCRSDGPSQCYTDCYDQEMRCQKSCG